MAPRTAREPVAPPMARGLIDRVAGSLSPLDPSTPGYVGQVVATILTLACETGASDVHFQPTEDQLNVSWRVDGVLQPIAIVPRQLAPNVVARLKVLADLLTYRSDVPQEGRLRDIGLGSQHPEVPSSEMRLSTFPTLYGEKAVARIFAKAGLYEWPQDLGLPQDLQERLVELSQETSGALLITGSAGSGKTTTAYACLRDLQRRSGASRSLVTLEDPIESALAGVSQSQVNRAAGFDYATGLRSLLRQDPDVILVGEIRDRETAETVFQACLTGHLVLTTFHAGNAAEAVCRLNDMGIEPYLIRAGLLGILCQRLFRALCDCARWTDDETERMGYDVPRVKVPVGCPNCDGTGYRGRMVLGELLLPGDHAVSRGILSRCDTATLNELAIQSGMNSIGNRAILAVAEGRTSPAEARRVLGFRSRSSATG